MLSSPPMKRSHVAALASAVGTAARADSAAWWPATDWSRSASASMWEGSPSSARRWTAAQRTLGSTSSRSSHSTRKPRSALSRASTRDAPGASSGSPPSTAPRAMSATTARCARDLGGLVVRARHELERAQHALDDQRVRLGPQVPVGQVDQVADGDDLRLGEVDRGPPQHRAGQLRLDRRQPGGDRGPRLLVGPDDREGLVAGVGHHDPSGEVLEPHRLVAEVHVAGADELHRVVVRRHGEAVRSRALAVQDRDAGVVAGHHEGVEAGRAQPRRRPGAHVVVGGGVEGVEEVGEVGVAEGVGVEVGVDAGEEVLLAEPVAQLLERGVALGVGDHVEVGEGGVDVDDLVGVLARSGASSGAGRRGSRWACG